MSASGNRQGQGWILSQRNWVHGLALTEQFTTAFCRVNEKQVMSPSQDYIQQCRGIVERVAEQEEMICEVAGRFAESILKGRVVHLFGSGHSRIMVGRCGRDMARSRGSIRLLSYP